MEETRHFVSSVYIVNDGAVALHDHKRLDYWLPAGGHIESKELPHEAGRREAKEETGLEVNIVDAKEPVSGAFIKEGVPEPYRVTTEEFETPEGRVYHNHINFTFFGVVDSREIVPEEGDEVSSDDWGWFTKDELKNKQDDPDFPNDIVSFGVAAIEHFE